MKQIDQNVPEGKTLIAGPVRFTGPCQAKASVIDGVTPKLIDTPARDTARPVDDGLTWQQRKADTEARRALADSDAGMARVTDDVVGALVAKGVIALADLPVAAQQKLTDRDTQRKALAGRTT